MPVRHLRPVFTPPSFCAALAGTQAGSGLTARPPGSPLEMIIGLERVMQYFLDHRSAETEAVVDLAVDNLALLAAACRVAASDGVRIADEIEAATRDRF